MFFKSCQRFFLILIFFSSINPAFTQSDFFSGLVEDARTSEALAFVNILINDSIYGGSTDIDGKFSLKVATSLNKAQFSFVGYETQVLHETSSKAFHRIKLKQKTIQLDEVVVKPGINPAHRIIQNAVDSSHQNDPKKLKAFRYTTYDRMVLSIDTTSTEKATKALKDFADQRDIMVLETVSEKSFMFPDKSFEKVVASKISGLKDPIAVFLLSQLHATDFYEESIRISDKQYVNPISRGSIEKYLFILEEMNATTTGDTLFTISYRPRRNTNFDGLKGTISIHSDSWAIQNVTASSANTDSKINIRIQQLYEKADGNQWFPAQLNTEISFQNVRPIKGYARSYLRDIEINPEIDKNIFSNTVLEVEKNAYNQNDEFWISHRADSLSKRMLETYRYIDSLGEAAQLDRMIRITESLMNGLLPVGKVDLNISNLIRFNDFEGFKPGLGLQTNRKLSRHFVAGAYLGYAFRKKQTTYDLNLIVPVIKKFDGEIKIQHYQNYIETGRSNIPDYNAGILTENSFRDYFINKMDFTNGLEIYYSFKAFNYLHFEAGLTRKDIVPADAYIFNPAFSDHSSGKNIKTEAFGISMGFTPNEKFISYNEIKTPITKAAPVLWVTFSQGNAVFQNMNEGYRKYEIRLENSWHLNYAGKTNIRLEAGIAEGVLPYPLLFNLPASYSNSGLYAPFSFATMRMNEFIADRYISMFFTQNFGHLLIKKKYFAPDIVIATNISFGGLKKSIHHKGIAFNTAEKGFFESGLLLRNLIKLPALKIGAGAFYRYGPYQYKRFNENLALKITLTVGL